jgi:RNA polymerase sigma-70 factor, ECF subfamily
MNGPKKDDVRALEDFQPYLKLLAHSLLYRHRQVKLDSSDLVQQTILDALANRGQFRGHSDGELAGWLRQILKNNIANGLRDQGRAKRDVRREQSLDAAIDDSFSCVDQWLAATQSSPSQQAVRHEELLRLSAALTQLPPAQQEAVVLHHLQGLKLAEVAAQLGRTEASVAGLLFRGLKTLHKLLEDHQ